MPERGAAQRRAAPAVASIHGLNRASDQGLNHESTTLTWQRVGHAAIASLYDELALTPKPGLVSLIDNGSHTDMNAATFMRSLFALRHYFAQIAAAGAQRAPFAELEALGIAAENRMLDATRGVNTHRGAVFTLGLLCASVGALATALAADAADAVLPTATPRQPGQGFNAAQLRATLLTHWGAALHARRQRGAGVESAAGFPTLFDCAAPALIAARELGLSQRDAHLQTLFHVMAVLDDTNLIHRGGRTGLRFAQAAAREFLGAGGVQRPDALQHAASIHRAFVARRLSPGGCADVLAAACLLERVGALR